MFYLSYTITNFFFLDDLTWQAIFLTSNANFGNLISSCLILIFGLIFLVPIFFFFDSTRVSLFPFEKNKEKTRKSSVPHLKLWFCDCNEYSYRIDYSCCISSSNKTITLLMDVELNCFHSRILLSCEYFVSFVI